MARPSLIDRMLLAAAKMHCRRVLSRIYDATRRATAVQDQVLMDKIRRNADSDYGRRYGFEHIRGYQDFKQRIPLQTYEDIEPYIDRLRRGEHQALFGGGQQVRMFALTSGTSGKPKYIPVTDAFLKEFRAGWNAFGIKALMDHEGNFLKPIVQITSRMDEFFTEAGIPCGAITGLMAATQKFLVRKYYITPLCVADILDPLARYYTIMRLAVPQRHIAFMVTANPATQLKLPKVAAEHAPELIRDIHDGTLWSGLDIPTQVRQALAPRLRADRRRAAEVQAALDEHGQLLPKHYWKLGFLCNWTGGTLGLYLRDFPHYFGDIPVRDIGLMASEGRMSIPVEDGTPAGILEVTSNFYEFIPSEQESQSAPDCLRSHEVEIGREYFVVLTNSAGFYRYRIGDQVRVRGFEGQAPIIEFLNKGAHICSLTGEKLTEHQVTQAVEAVCAASQVPVKSYVVAPQWGDPPYYLMHVELQDGAGASALADFTADVDRRLCALNIEYASKMKSLRLGALRLNILPAGFLERRDRELSVRHRKSNEQYKHQFLLSLPGQDADFPGCTRTAREPQAQGLSGGSEKGSVM